jgi:hypothetical protein
MAMMHWFLLLVVGRRRGSKYYGCKISNPLPQTFLRVGIQHKGCDTQTPVVYHG